MERTGNSIGAEGRRQHDEEDPNSGDRQHRQERLADQEVREGEEQAAQEAEDSEALTAEAQADGVPDDAVTDPEGVKPATELRLEQADVDADQDREQ